MCAYESMNRTCGCFVASASGSNSAASAVSNRRKCILIALPSLQLRSLRLSRATSGTARRAVRYVYAYVALTTRYTRVFIRARRERRRARLSEQLMARNS